MRPSKKNTCFSSPPASFFSAASFFFIFYEQRFYEQKPTDVIFVLVNDLDDLGNRGDALPPLWSK